MNYLLEKVWKLIAYTLCIFLLESDTNFGGEM